MSRFPHRYYFIQIASTLVFASIIWFLVCNTEPEISSFDTHEVTIQQCQLAEFLAPILGILLIPAKAIHWIFPQSFSTELFVLLVSAVFWGFISSYIIHYIISKSKINKSEQ